jgi:Asp-tRNA(Asn)/Glu-tRNA(Gln) amidotransferase A subunit family amidase
MSARNKLDLAQAAARVKDGTVSSTELACECLARIDALEPRVRAWATINRDEALREAAQLDAERGRGALRGILHGVPLGVKDVFYTAGVRTAAGSRVLADFVPRYDAAAVRRLKQAGALILGKTATTEFAYLDPTDTRNPWQLEHTPGGSSSGSAAAVAARMCFGALGTQTVGSTIRPAAYCGIVGLKPTYGRISRAGLIPLAEGLDHVGILARTVTDAALMLQVLAGHDADDVRTVAQPVPDYLSVLQSTDKPPRIGILRSGIFADASDEMKAQVENVAQRFGRAGAEVIEIASPKTLSQVAQALAVEVAYGAAAWGRTLSDDNRAKLGPKIRELIDRGLEIRAEQYEHAERFRDRFRADVIELLRRVDLLLAPSTPTSAPQGLASTGDPRFIAPWTFAGVPVVGIPIGLDKYGLPLGIQLISAPFSEDLLLAHARWCETVLAFDHSPPVTFMAE